MNPKLMAVAGVAGISVLGLAALAMSGGEAPEAILEPAVIAQASDDAVEFVEPTQAQKEFQSFAVEDKPQECKAPKPPKELADLALTRNGLYAILQIMAAQRWQETGSCECFVNQITWEEVLVAAPEFERTDGVNLRIDVPKLRSEADALIAQRAEVCAG